MTTLYLYTLMYPSGTKESFLVPEIPILAAHFDRVEIIYYSNQGAHRPLPENVTAHHINFDSDNERVSKGSILNLIGGNLFKLRFLKDFRYQWSLAARLISESKSLQKFLVEREEGIHYSYWMDGWATILGLLKKEGIINRYVSRAHGFDLYDERARLGYHPYRKYQASQADLIAPISQMGLEYLKERIDTPVERFYLGTESHGLASYDENASFRIVSCSALIPLKRVTLIAKAIENIGNSSIQWVHIGDGPEMKELENITANWDRIGVNYEFKGSLQHADVINELKTGGYSLFLNFSTTEGVPVSIMEAISFGIPVMATDVGGVKEIVTNQTGVLLDPKSSVSDLTKEILSFRDSQKNTMAFHHEVRKFWEENFDANKNYPAFCDRLKKLA